MNVGILFPASTAHANIGFDFMNGLKTFLKENALDEKIQFTSESVAMGGVEKDVYEKAEKLLTIDGVDVLLAFIDERVLVLLKPLLYASGKLAIIINPGANYPVNWVPEPNIVHLTLQHAFCTWLTGIMAAKAADKNALTVTTFYDCGYLHAASMAKSFLRDGGNITFNYVNKDKYDATFNIDPLTDFLEKDTTTNNALCIFDSYPASLFYKLLNENKKAEALHIYASPMMFEQKALEAADNGFKFSIDGYLPWKISADSESNRSFTEIYQQKNKKEATMFAVLGWEAGMVIKQVIERCADNYTDGGAVVEELKKASMEGPRGSLKLNGETHYFLATVGKAAIKKDSTAIDIQWRNDYMEEWQRFIDEPTQGAVSGWTNTYLCY